ncbi:MAG: hypothetical protein CM15mV70_130 [Caudoviricetes sp.]|nr:MAG: hypothetical protein CM15mV70_130 [Caudoviricetes sp.]
MEKTKVCIWLDPDLHQFLDETKGEELKIPQYIRLILKQKMKTAAKRKPKAFKENTDPFASPNITSEMIPDNLKGYADLIIEWWAIRYTKKATCSTKVAERIFDKLGTFVPSMVAKSLEKAIAGGWKDIYEIKESKFTEEPKNNHPASRVFTAKGGFES